VFGGSIGIATSTAILGIKQRQQLLETGMLKPSQIQSLREAMSHFTPDQIHMVKQAYTDAFDETLVVCSIIAGLSVIITTGCWKKNPVSIEERRKQQVTNEAIRQRALAETRARAASIHNNKPHV
jgi:hypothetical protein